jgi:hypothetical protein
MNRRSFALVLFRFALAYAVLASLVVVFERPLNAALGPCVKVGMSLLHPEIQVRRVSAEESRLSAEVRVFRNGRRFTGTVAANGDRMLVGPLLALAVVAAWPFRSGRERAFAGVLGTLCVLALAVHDIATAMSLGVSGNIGRAVDASDGFYSFFMDSGGRQLLALSAAGAAIYLAAAFGGAPSRAAPTTNG